LKENSNDQQSQNPGASFVSNIISATSQQVLNIYNQQYDTRYLYHSYERTVGITGKVEEIAKAMSLSDASMEIVLIAAWFHETGYLVDSTEAVAKGMDLARTFLSSKGYPTDKLQKVLACINATGDTVNPITAEEQILNDAISAYTCGENFGTHRPLLRLEWELLQNRHLSAFEWQQLQMQALLQARFLTPFGKLNYAPIVAENIRSQKSKVEKAKVSLVNGGKDDKGNLRMYQQIGPKNSGGGVQTFFRTNYRNHINLSAIADNKANIMISVNAILISVIISMLSYRNISQTQPMVLLPVVIFLITGLTSLICAVLSIRPKVTTKHDGLMEMEEAKKNIVFFGNFIHLDLEQYEEAMDAVLRDGELLYGNMVRDLYFLGKVLDKKYRYLTMSYNIFMIGFIATVITFLIAIFS
jgi:predicted metal-dependent HD superfamily phosphohydrolase